MKIPFNVEKINFKNIYCIPVMDKLCCQLFFKNDKINTQRVSPQSKNEVCNNLINTYLKIRFNDSESLNETLYRIYKNIKIRPICRGCGKPATYMGAGKFQRFCSVKCAMNSEEVKQHCKELLQEKYGVDNVYQLESVKNKIKETCLEKYGVNMPLQNKDIREKSKQTCLEKYGVEYTSQSETLKEKRKQTCIKRYGGNAPACSKDVQNKMQQTCLEKYGKTLYNKTDEFKNIWKDEKRKAQIKQKEYLTKKKNNSFRKSTPEIKILEKLQKLHPDVIYQFKDNVRYPFNCDFYIPSLDLFIEYNGHWTHGEHTFDKNNPLDIERLEFMKERENKSVFYKTAIYVWTFLDPLKVKTAKENNLNYLILWPNDYKNNNILEKIKEFEK